MFIPRLRFVSILLILPKLPFAIAILDLISASHLPSSDIRLPRYLKELTCLTASPLTWASTLSCSVLFVIPITSVFPMFIFNPIALPSSSNLSISSCNLSSVSANNIVSSAYLILLMFPPPYLDSIQLLHLIHD